MYYIGIDPSWTGNNNTAIVICDRQCKIIKYLYTKKIEEIIMSIVPYKPAIVGIDAPCIVKNSIGHRNHEITFLKLFSRFGLGMHAVNKKRYPYFFPEMLYRELNKLGFEFSKKNIYEVYPHATIMICFNDMKLLKYKAKYKADIRRKNMIQLIYMLHSICECRDLFPETFHTMKGMQLKKYEDLLDALVCAYTVYYCTHNDCYILGNDEDGILIIPKIPCV